MDPNIKSETFNNFVQEYSLGQTPHRDVTSLYKAIELLDLLDQRIKLLRPNPPRNDFNLWKVLLRPFIDRARSVRLKKLLSQPKLEPLLEELRNDGEALAGVQHAVQENKNQMARELLQLWREREEPEEQRLAWNVLKTAFCEEDPPSAKA